MSEQKNYFDTIEYMLQNESRFNWDYYHCQSRCKTVGNVFDRPKSFIDNTFIYAKKQLLLSTNHNDRHHFCGPNISPARAAHSISSFFTGIILGQGLLGENMDSFCHLYGTHNGVFSFPYVWNLTCLYHDFGYEFENDIHSCEMVKWEIDRLEERNNARNRSIKSLQLNVRSFPAVSKVFSIRRTHLSVGLHSFFNRDDSAEGRFILHYIRTNKNGMLCNGGPVKIPYRSADQVERYLNYRLFGYKSSCLDHGIMGGLSFFNLIIENYIKEYTENRSVWQNQNFTALVGYKFEKVDFYKNPLLFILVMADCLEPYKNYCKVHFDHGIDERAYDKNEVMSIFKDYSLTVIAGRIVITVPDCCIVACEDKLKDMHNWISIRYTRKVNKFYITPITV